MNNRHDGIEIAGMGLVTCLGCNVKAVFDAMVRGECGIRAITRFDASDFPQPNGGQLEESEEKTLRERFPDEDLAAAMVQAAGLEALGGPNTQNNPRRGLVLATNFGPVESLEWSWRERLDMGTLDQDTFSLFDDVTGRIARAFGCAGPTTQISMSCASGAAAVFQAKQWLEKGRADQVLAIGYDMLSEFVWTGLTNLRTISTDRMRPFDANRSGTIFSEGAAAMLLERRDPNADDLRRPLIAGAAVNNNAFHMTAPPKEAEGSRRVMAAALQDAGFSPEAIDHASAHATATAANDVTEAAALRNLFGNHLDNMTVAAHKSQLGHMMGAAGLAEAIITVCALRNGIIPPTIHHEVPDPNCKLDCVPATARPTTARTAITNSAGIGGNNGALIMTI
ncbi:MAG: beta-ketoacyl-[acyl-carrier-protein] synthase family protein [Verrucomicrobiota bacterium]